MLSVSKTLLIFYLYYLVRQSSLIFKFNLFINLDASDILKGNLKLILGLIWTLILKYQISLPMMDDDDEAKNITPKQALMGWIKSKLPPEVFIVHCICKISQNNLSSLYYSKNSCYF